MAKILVENSSRKPPEAAADHAPVEAWIARAMPGLQPLLRELDRLIRDTVPGLEFAVKWGHAWYGLPGRGWIVELAGYHVSANLVFPAGARFDPPPPLGEGSRYVKLHGLEEARAPEVREWIRQAGKHDGWGASDAQASGRG